MDVLILTSNLRNSASLHLETLLTSDKLNVKMVIYNQGKVMNKRKYYRRRVRKIFKIGPLGALNGVRMRKWYSTDIINHLNIAPIDEICRQNNIPFKTTPNINHPDTILFMKNSGAELGISIGNSYIGERVFKTPRYGMINIHYEELPLYQNANAVIWQIYNASDHSGYTIHEIDKHIDTGNILLKELVPITFHNKLGDTVTHTLANIIQKSTGGMVKVLENFEHFHLARTSQKNGVKYTTPSISQFLRMLRTHKAMKVKSLIGSFYFEVVSVSFELETSLGFPTF
ncbi:hypothetical protein F8C76_02980 [Flagellimonas olearia]|uniref:Formyl transferase N-terminal domain-containing protein n=1 Tax=Flagellimonas olearia TaxID=552546 RepID=A0A6I1DY33_9FLAO|nr:formyltransferase family protein [Allomuricauda olearia]KAB7530486.1 hypothetical protein F8C76_02980 [Allomuricauda olearia]